jgi:putative transposase
MVGAAIRQVFAASSRDEASAILGDVVDRLQAPAPKVAELLEQAKDDLLAFLSFPPEHRSKLRSTNPLERVNREIARRSDVVGIYPNDASLIRLAGCLLIEQCDEWLVTKRYLSHESIALLYPNERSALADAGQPALQSSAGRHRQETRTLTTT